MSVRHLQSSRPFLSLLDATFRLGDRLVFAHSNWTFGRDEHWAILGANGSGKSLLADGLRGQVPLVGGELRYRFRPPPGLSPEQTIGHVSFEARKHEVRDTVVQSRWNSLEEDGALRVSEFLSYERVMDINPFEITEDHGPQRRQFAARHRRAIRLLRIESFVDRTLLSLSNGETQRVQLARALCRPLRLLILDEPCLGLDVATRNHFHGVLEQLMATPLRVLLVTTRPEDLPRHISHVLRVEDCRIVAAGERKVLLSKTSTPKRLIGLPLRTPESASHAPRRSSRSDAPALVSMRNITVRYGTATILRGLNWTVRAGESWALLGPNGSGKTTLLSLILGDNPQVYGNDVEVFGIKRGSGESIWDIKWHIGWVSPELHLHFNDAATCLEVVASGFRDTIGLFEPPTAPQRRSAKAKLAEFGLEAFVQEPLFALSAGLQRMVLLARALVKKPKLLILDEPCQGLDPEHRAQFVRCVDELLRRQELTAIYVTHREDEIPPSVQQVLRLPCR